MITTYPNYSHGRNSLCLATLFPRLGMGSNRRARRKAGFTLVELLIVLTILGVLIGVGLQQFGALRAGAVAEKNRVNQALINRTFEHWTSAGGTVTGTISDANAAARQFVALMLAAPGTPSTATGGGLTYTDNTTTASNIRLKSSGDMTALSTSTTALSVAASAGTYQFSVAPTFNP